MKILDFQYINNLGISANTIYQWCIEAWKIKKGCILPPKIKMWEENLGGGVGDILPCLVSCLCTILLVSNLFQEM